MLRWVFAHYGCRVHVKNPLGRATEKELSEPIPASEMKGTSAFCVDCWVDCRVDW